MRMPPLPFEYHGRDAAARFFSAMRAVGRVRRFLSTRANDQPAYAGYAEDPVTGLWHAMGLFVLSPSGTRVRDITGFEPALLAHFGLPAHCPSENRRYP